MPTTPPVASPRSLRVFLMALLCFLPFATAGAQAYTSVVIFGDSLSDTGNDAALSYALYGMTLQVPGPLTGYTNGRFTDGTDTVPAAHNYTGVWIEQLANLLPAKPAILNSLSPGGTNYAYGFATTGTGTTVFTYPAPASALSFTVNNMQTQLASYLATSPAISNRTLFVVWGGANDLIAAVASANPTAAIQAAASNEAGIIQTLVNAGATDFLIPNLPPLGLVPRFNGSTTTSTPATTAAVGFNTALAALLQAIPAANPGKTLHLYSLDTFTLYNTVAAAPAARGFANVTASSQFNASVNPDTYLFWDDLHPTTYGHNQLATTAFTLLGPALATTTVLTTPFTAVNLNSAVALQANVTDTAAASTPLGTVTFFDGNTALSSSLVTGSNMQGTAAYSTSSLAAGTHSITAQFAGTDGYVNSTSSAVQVVVTAPAFTAALSPSTLTVSSGSAGSAMVTLTPVGGYSGTATLACGALPPHFSCSVSPSSLTLANNTTVSATVTIGTSAMAALERPDRPGSSERQTTVLACSLLPGLGWLLFAFSRRRRAGVRGLLSAGLLTLVAGVFAVSLSGCSSSNNNNAAKGSYTVPITVTANSSTTTQSLTVVVQ